MMHRFARVARAFGRRTISTGARDQERAAGCSGELKKGRVLNLGRVAIDAGTTP